MLHLFHPALVHFSVAFLVFGAPLEAYGLVAGRQRAAGLGGTLVLLGTISLLLTIASGYVAANTVDLPAGAVDLLAAHERNGWFVLGLFFAAVFWKAWCRGVVPASQRWFYAALLLAAAGLAVYSAYLGAEMVYGHAVGVRPV